MIPAYYINLERSKERRNHFEKLSEKNKILICRVNACDGQILEGDDVGRVYRARDGERQLTRSEVACFLSHREAWKRIAGQDSRHGAVFEDDVYFSTRLQRLLTDPSWLTGAMHVVKLDKATRRHIELGATGATAGGVRIRELLSLHVGCGAYILSRDCAAALLERTETFSQPVDHAIFDPATTVIPDFMLWQAVPAVCIHQQFSSEHFLPEAAERSSLEAGRVESKQVFRKRNHPVRHLVGKMWIELKRPAVRLSLFLWKKLACHAAGRSWVKLEYNP